MNINDYEKLEADPDVRDRVASSTFYALGKANNPHFTALWARVPKEEKEKAAMIGFEAILAIVDDYTTPGCDCNYCRSNGAQGHGQPIMCRQRWNRLPRESQHEIAESCSI